MKLIVGISTHRRADGSCAFLKQIVSCAEEKRLRRYHTLLRMLNKSKDIQLVIGAQGEDLRPILMEAKRVLRKPIDTFVHDGYNAGTAKHLVTQYMIDHYPKVDRVIIDDDAKYMLVERVGEEGKTDRRGFASVLHRLQKGMRKHSVPQAGVIGTQRQKIQIDVSYKATISAGLYMMAHYAPNPFNDWSVLEDKRASYYLSEFQFELNRGDRSVAFCYRRNDYQLTTMNPSRPMDHPDYNKNMQMLQEEFPEFAPRIRRGRASTLARSKANRRKK